MLWQYLREICWIVLCAYFTCSIRDLPFVFTRVIIPNQRQTTRVTDLWSIVFRKSPSYWRLPSVLSPVDISRLEYALTNSNKQKFWYLQKSDSFRYSIQDVLRHQIKLKVKLLLSLSRNGSHSEHDFIFATVHWRLTD